MKTASATTLSLLLVLILAASCSAASVPPGNGAATQYTETLPGAGGEEAAHGVGGPERGGRKSDVPLRAQAGLAELGREGEAALQLADRTAQPHLGQRGDGGPAGRSGDSGKPGRSLSARAEGGSSGIDEVLGATIGTSGGGLGFLQLLILVAVVLLAGAYLFQRRSRDPA